MVGASQISWVAPIVVALISALGAYLLVVRKASGRIVTTEAGDLWKEAKDLRDAYLQDINRLSDRLLGVEARLKIMEAEREELLETNSRLEIENLSLRSKNDTLEDEVEKLKARLAKLESETQKLKENGHG